MAEIVPAILPKSYEELVQKLSIAAKYTKSVQIDVCDGTYVQSKTWPYLKNDKDQIFESIVNQKTALAHWQEIDFEFDLMVKNPHEKIADFISAGASRIIVHRGSVGEDELTAILNNYGKRSEKTSVFDIELGIALLPGDSADFIKNIASQIHFVQVMGIRNIGFQGQEFDPKSAELVHALKTAYPKLQVSVDGGIDLENAKILVAAGADRLIVGSYLFNSKDFSGTLEELGFIS